MAGDFHQPRWLQSSTREWRSKAKLKLNLVTGSTSTCSIYTTTVSSHQPLILLRSLDLHIAAPVEAPKPATVPSKPINMLPWPQDPHFIGREDILGSMSRSLDEAGSVALTGAGGVGYAQQMLESK
jgi:hypothetical protein